MKFKIVMNCCNVIKMRGRLAQALTLVVLVLLISISCTDNQIPPLPSRIPLRNAIIAANSLVTLTFEGSAPGDYLPGSRVSLKNAIVIAQKVLVQEQVTQDLLTQTIDNLNAAVDFYQSKATPAIDPTNLVAQYTFDQISNDDIVGINVKDYSGNNNNGITKQGNDYWGRGIPTIGTDRNGVSGRALHFSYGANIEIPYTALLNSPSLSISLWLRQDVNSPTLDNQILISLNRAVGFKVAFDATPTYQFSATTNENPGTSFTYGNGKTLVQGAWYHMVITFGDGHLKFYTNGILVNDILQGGTLLTQSTPVNLVIGQDLPNDVYTDIQGDPHYLNDGGFYNGYIDEIRIYKSVLTQDLINTIYSLEHPQ